MGLKKSFKKKNMGLVLGGGGTKGFVHLGAIKYLEEKGVSITEVAGTSIGSIVGALYCSGKSYQDIYDAFSTIKTSDIIDRDLKQGMIKGNKIINRIGDICGNIQFSDLKIPLKIIATDINTGKEKVFSSGSVLEAIRHSISIPGVFSVTQNSEDEQFYIDGGLVNNLPVSHIENKRVIAVSCLGISPFKARKHITVFGKKIDTTFLSVPKRVIYRSLCIMMSNNENEQIKSHDHATVIRPNLTEISFYDLSALDRAIEIGYKATKKELREQNHKK